MEGCAERMISKMIMDENLRDIIPEMMAKFMPKCLEHMLPYLSEEKRAAFAASMKSLMESSDQSVYSPV